MAGRADRPDRGAVPRPAARGAADLDEGAPEVPLGAQPGHRPHRGLHRRRQPRDRRRRRHDPRRQRPRPRRPPRGRGVLLGERPRDPARGDGGETRRRHLPQQARQPGRPHRPDRGARARDRARRVGADPDLAERAARLAKADLASQMVYEFPELQGVMGRYYAERAGEDSGRRRRGGGALLRRSARPTPCRPRRFPSPWRSPTRSTCLPASGPSTRSRRARRTRSRCVARRSASSRIVLERLAARLESEATCCGSARRRRFSDRSTRLRRAGANSSQEVGGMSRSCGRRPCADVGQHRRRTSLAFLHDRLKVHLRDQGVRHDVIDACLAMPGSDDLVLVVARAGALQDFLATEDGANLLAGLQARDQHPRRRRRRRTASSTRSIRTPRSPRRTPSARCSPRSTPAEAATRPGARSRGLRRCDDRARRAAGADRRVLRHHRRQRRQRRWSGATGCAC